MTKAIQENGSISVKPVGSNKKKLKCGLCILGPNAVSSKILPSEFVVIIN